MPPKLESQAGESRRPDHHPRSGSEGGPNLQWVAQVLSHRQQRLGLSVRRLAKRSALSIAMVKQATTNKIGRVPVQDLGVLAEVLGLQLKLELVSRLPQLPATNDEILAEYDQLMGTRGGVPFHQDQPDKEHPLIRWNVVGDSERNRLYVVACNPQKGIRFARVTDRPGGWSIRGQIFGIDCETNSIAYGLAQELFQAHRSELLGLGGPKKKRKTLAVT